MSGSRRAGATSKGSCRRSAPGLYLEARRPHAERSHGLAWHKPELGLVECSGRRLIPLQPCGERLQSHESNSGNGSLAAAVMADAVVRLRPGALGNEASAGRESFDDGLLEYPQYTRPPEFRGLKVPEVLVSGDHGAIERWRREQSRERTRARRPDLWAGRSSSGTDDGSGRNGE